MRNLIFLPGAKFSDLHEVVCYFEKEKDGMCQIQTITNFHNWTFMIARRNNTKPDKLVSTAPALIHMNKDDIWISELMDQLHISVVEDIGINLQCLLFSIKLS